MKGKAKRYRAGQLYRIALNRVRAHPRDLPDIPNKQLRILMYKLKQKWEWRSQWYQGIPPIKVRYEPKFSSHNFVLIEGGESYQAAKKIGIDTINCIIAVGDEPCDLGMWFD